MAIGIVAFAVIAILGLVPVGLNSGRESIDSTHASLIAQEVYDRTRSSLNSNNSSSQHYFAPFPTGTASFFFYTLEGSRTGELLKVQFPNDQPAFYQNVKSASDFYRAKVTMGVFDQSASYSQYDPRAVVAGTTPNLLCASVEVAWPINKQDGSISGKSTKKAHYTFFIRKP